MFIGFSAMNTIIDTAAEAPVRAMAIVDCLMNIWFDLFSSMPLLMSSRLVLRLTDVKYSDRYPTRIIAPDMNTTSGFRTGSSIWGFCIRFSQSSRL